MTESTTREAWQTGYEAGRNRQALMSNPYPAGTEQFRTWQAGWREGEGVGRKGDHAPYDGPPRG